MQIKKLPKSELADISHLQTEGCTDITDTYRFYVESNYCKPVCVEKDGRIVGIGCAICFSESAFLSHIIVDKDYRRQGIGSFVVKYLLNDLKKRNIENVMLVTTPEDETIYSKAGFRKVSGYRSFKKDRDTVTTTVHNKIRPYQKEYYASILRLDKYINGENRERLLKQYLDSAYVYVDGDKLVGFYIPQLGEGPVYAKTDEAGKALLQLKYSLAEQVVLPEENMEGISYVQELGYVETGSKSSKMIFGGTTNWNPSMIYSRIGGNFG